MVVGGFRVKVEGTRTIQYPEVTKELERTRGVQRT